MPTKHYRYGGSTAGRTIQCPAWRLLADTLPKKPEGSSPDADRGTLLHDCMEALLRNPDMDVKDCLGREYNGQVVTEDELHDAIIPALDAYLDFAEENDIDIELVEVETVKTEEVGGTSDIIGANEDTIFIMDWKFGYNPVSPVNNPQALFYAMCARYEKEIKKLFETRNKLCLVIIQPQAEDIVQAWHTDIERLNDFEKAHELAVANQDINRCQIGEYCKFCPSMPICPAKNGEARRALMLDPYSENAQNLPEALALADQVIEWAQSVKKFAHEQAELGLKIDGFKLVNKRATRKWTDEDAVFELVRKARLLKIEDATDVKLKSPAQLEKVCKKLNIDFDKYAAYIESVSSGTTLTTADDKRPEAVNVSALAAAIAQSE